MTQPQPSHRPEPASARLRTRLLHGRPATRLRLAPALAGMLLALLAGPLTVAATELNLASQAELEQLKRLGPQLTQRILDERSRQGPFRDWPDFLRRMKGVGPATAQRLSAAGLRIAGQAYPAPPVAESASASAG